MLTGRKESGKDDRKTFYFGADYQRTMWIFKNFYTDTIKLSDSSMIKEWELLQVVSSFLLGAGILNAFFTSSTKCTLDAAVPPSQPSDVVEAAAKTVSGITLVALFTILMATSLCRVFVYGQHTMLYIHGKRIVKGIQDQAEQVNYLKTYWFSMEEDMQKLASLIGTMSAFSKGLFLLVVLLWMANILLVARDLAPPPVFYILVVLVALSLTAFMGCVFILLYMAMKNQRVGTKSRDDLLHMLNPSHHDEL